MSKKKPCPLWTLVALALLGASVVYVATFGPAMWLAGKGMGFRAPIAAVYWPLGRLAVSEDAAIQEPLARYVALCASGLGGFNSGGIRTDAFEVPTTPTGGWRVIWRHSHRGRIAGDLNGIDVVLC